MKILRLVFAIVLMAGANLASAGMIHDISLCPNAPVPPGGTPPACDPIGQITLPSLTGNQENGDNIDLEIELNFNTLTETNITSIAWSVGVDDWILSLTSLVLKTNPGCSAANLKPGQACFTENYSFSSFGSGYSYSISSLSASCEPPLPPPPPCPPDATVCDPTPPPPPEPQCFETSAPPMLGSGIVEFTPVHVPEPTTLALMGLGIAGLGFRRKTL